MHNDETEAARRYHSATSHSEQSLRRNRHSLDWENQPIPFKLYRAGESVPLVEWKPRETPGLVALERIGMEADATAERRPDLRELSELLFLAAGITKVRRHAGGESLHLRAYPNTGALHHVDLYVVCRDLEGLPAGVYHFGPHDFALRRLRAGDWRAALALASGGEPALGRAPLVVASASTYWRNAWKYQARAYRHSFWDGGTLHANLLAAAAAAELPARLVLGFADGAVERLLGLDPEREGAIALVALGRDGAPPPPVPGAPPELRLATQPLSAHEVDYPEIRALHAASSLPDGAAAARWRGGLGPRALPPARGRLFPLDPPPQTPQESFESVIRRRGSTREFDPQASLGRGELGRALAVATRGLAADFIEPGGSSLIEPYLIVHAVEGLPAGSYFYRREERALELLREGDFRGQAGRLGLFQELPRDCCVDLYCLAPLDTVLARFGNRGYRAAQLEGGIVGGRAYLAAYAQGFGASGLTFLDDEVTEFFSPHAAGKAVMFLVALGRSAWRRR